MQKARTVCVYIVLILLLSGCGSSALRAVPPPIPDSFSCDVRITTKEETIEGNWVMTHGDSVFTLRAPEALAGFVVRMQGDNMEIEYDDVSAVLTSSSCFFALRDAYFNLLNGACEAKQTPQGWLYDDRNAHGFAVLQDAQSGLPLRISVPEQSVTLQIVTENDSDA